MSSTKSSIRATRSVRPTRASKPTFAEPPAMTKTFIKAFSSDVAITPQPIADIPNYEQNKALFKLNNDVHFNGFIQRRNKILFIYNVSSKGKVYEVQYYVDLIRDSKLVQSDYFTAETEAYFLIYKNKNIHPVLYWDFRDIEQEEPKECEGDQFTQSLIGLAEAFGVNSSINVVDARSELTNIIQKLYDNLGYDTKTRTTFIIITWILLEHDEICFKRHPTRGPLGLRQWIELNNSHAKAKDKTSKEYLDDEKFLKGTQPIEVIKGFESVLQKKISDLHERDLKDFETESNKQQIEKLSVKINNLYNPKNERKIMYIVDALYNQVFKKHPHVDISKLAFDAEQKWRQLQKGNNRNDSLGQFYTPQMIKDLVVKYIFGGNIEDGMSCYDPTCGTGGFTRSFYNYCSENGMLDITAYGNEIDEDCANMAWLAGLGSKCDARFFESDCFNPELKDEIIPAHEIDFLLMNPPFGTKVQGNFLGFAEGFDWNEDERWSSERKVKPTEWTFCRYNMESFLNIGGWFAFIVPISALSKKEFEYDKQCMINKSEIWFIIRFNENIFQPQTGQPICLILGKYCESRTPEQIETWKTKCIDFSEDSGKMAARKNAPYVYEDVDELERMIQMKILNGKETEGLFSLDDESVCPLIRNVKLIADNEEGKEFYVERVLKANENWLFKKYNKDEEGMRLRYRLNRLDAIHAEQRTRIIQEELEAPELIENENCDWREVKISDIFDIMKKPSGELKYDVSECSATMTETKQCPYYSMIDHNNGLKGYVEKPAVSGNDWYIIVGNYSSKAKSGKQTSNHKNSYCCYVIQAPFNYSISVTVMKPKSELSYLTTHDLHFIAFNIGLEFTERFSFGDALNGSKLCEQVVKLPFDTEDDKLKPSVCSWYDCDEWRVRYRDVRVDEMFEIAGKGSQHALSELRKGKYPFISNATAHHGICAYVDYFDFKGTFMTVSSDGHKPGSCFVHSGEFAVQDTVNVLKLRPEYEYILSDYDGLQALQIISMIMTNHFTIKHGYADKFYKTKLFSEIIPQLPFIDDPLNPEHEILDISTLQTMLLQPAPTQTRRKQIQQEMKEQKQNSSSTTTKGEEYETLDEYADKLINESAKRTAANEENQKRRTQAEQLKQLNHE